MRILLGTDGSPSAGVAADLVAGIAWPSGTAIRVVEAIQPSPMLYTDPWPPVGLASWEEVEADAEAAARATVEGVRARLEQPGVEVSTSVVTGRPATTLLDAAQSMPADVIFLGSRGHGTIESMVLGSVSAEVIDHAHAPVLVARRPTIGRIVLAWDGSDCAGVAAQLLKTWPMFQGAEIDVVSVAEIDFPWWTGFPGTSSAQLMPMYVEAADATRQQHAELAAGMARELEAAGFAARAVPREGDAAGQIIAAAKAAGADIIVVGTHGRTGLQRLLLGSVARNVVQHAAASVLVVRTAPAGRAAPTGEIA
jgi:nucleotide-binding universal stress UspA family protein